MGCGCKQGWRTWPVRVLQSSTPVSCAYTQAGEEWAAAANEGDARDAAELVMDKVGVVAACSLQCELDAPVLLFLEVVGPHGLPAHTPTSRHGVPSE